MYLCVLEKMNHGGMGQGGQNRPPPVPCSPASRTFICRLPPFSVLLPSRDFRSSACLTLLQFDSLRHTCALMPPLVTYYDLYDITTANACTISPEASLFFSPSANFRLLVCSAVSIETEKTLNASQINNLG